MLTPSPCYDIQTRTDCPRRCVGCRSTCEDWTKWKALHDAEKDRIYAAKSRESDINTFESERYMRDKRDRINKMQKEKRRERHEGL